MESEKKEHEKLERVTVKQAGYVVDGIAEKKKKHTVPGQDFMRQIIRLIIK